MVQRSCQQQLAGLATGTRAYDDALASARAQVRACRNQPGGYWIAKDDPLAAEHAVTGSVPVTAGAHLVLLSNGVTRLVTAYGLWTWASLLEACRTEGPAEILRALRAHESSRSTIDGDALPMDDETLAWWILQGRAG